MAKKFFCKLPVLWYRYCYGICNWFKKFCIFWCVFFVCVFCVCFEIIQNANWTRNMLPCRKHLNFENREVIRCFLLNQRNTDSFTMRHEQHYYTFACVFDWGINFTTFMEYGRCQNGIEWKISRMEWKTILHTFKPIPYYCRFFSWHLKKNTNYGPSLPS